ncbi:helix-turn-helix domain-containing protein [Sphingobacterium hungaricum]
MENYHKYLNISELEKKWNFYITTVGYSKTEKNIDYPNPKDHPLDHGFSWNKGRILDGFYVVFITSGRGIFECESIGECAIHAGTCFVLFPGVWHRYKPDLTTGWEEYWVGFKGSYPQQLMESFFDQKVPIIKTGISNKLIAAFTDLLSTVHQAEIGYPQMITGQTLQIIAVLNRVKLMEEIKDDPESLWVSKVIFLLQHQLDRNLNIEELAAEFPISYSKFRKVFKSLIGVAPNQYHLELRLHKSKELLEEGNMSTKEIAYRTGFTSPHYFSRLYKKKFGFPPKVSRRG